LGDNKSGTIKSIAGKSESRYIARSVNYARATSILKISAIFTELFTILVRYGKVDSWNCQGPEASDCKARYGNEVPSDYSKAVSFPSYFLWDTEVTDGHNATVFIRAAKISLPFVQYKSH
jgi:hypothetical protein